jgi:phage protein D
MSTVDTAVMLAGCTVKLNGTPVDQTELQEVRVQDSVSLPSAFSLTFVPPAPTDPDQTDPLAMKTAVKIGSTVEIAFQGAHQRDTTTVISGEITALEPRFEEGGASLVASGYDRSHRLHGARKTATFQDVTVGDIAGKVCQAAGLSLENQARGPKYKFMQQNNETEWEFLQRLAALHDLELVVKGEKLTLREAGTADGQPVELEFSPTQKTDYDPLTLLSFNPRVSVAQQVGSVEVRAWDPQTKDAIVAEQKVEQKGSSIGITRSEAATSFPAGNGKIVAADSPVPTPEHAQALATSLASYLGHAFCGAYGSCEGHPRVRAGTTLKIKGLGPKFTGEYRCTSTTHVYAGSSGYVTRFEVLGRTPRDLIDLAGAAQRSAWGDSLVVGVVTNNKDPDKLARVRVKFPALDATTEGWWARVVGTGAGAPERGQMMLPRVNDEVLVGFEGGDPHRPYVLGGLWNGKDTPGKELPGTAESDDPDGSYVLRNDKKIDVGAKDNITIKTDKDMLVEIKGALTEKVQKDVTREVQGGEKHSVAQSLTIEVKQSGSVKASQSLTLEATTELVLKCGGAQIKLSSAGVDISGTKVSVQGQSLLELKGSLVKIN